jgi:dTDP-glucose 4,6-dehydratase
MKVLVTGGAGFIGSHFVRLVLRERPDWDVVNLDKLTYAGNLENLADVAGNPRYRFVQGDIGDPGVAGKVMAGVDAVVNFAAETHVDRSIMSADEFLRTDILGVHNLLETARKLGTARFVQISTDEVYGSIATGSATEDAPLTPNSPYASSKAGGDLLALAYHRTHGLPVVITRSSNNYGPNQYPEKVIPLFITNLLEGKKVPLYGDGQNVRDWLHVEDNCRAVLLVLEKGEVGQAYNIGGGHELTNKELTAQIIAAMGKGPESIEPVTDRPGHDRRYSVDCARTRALGWAPAIPFERGLAGTIDWYAANRGWWERIKSGEYRDYYRQQYRSAAR